MVLGSLEAGLSQRIPMALDPKETVYCGKPYLGLPDLVLAAPLALP